MYVDDDLIPLSALQHWLYCPRQFGLIHVEQSWSENRFTVEGKILHARAHYGHDESRPGVRVTRGLPVRSLVLGLTGQCDIVEFHGNGEVFPVEYKRGKPKSHRADEVQVCAQAMCLEEMLGVEVRHAYLYYGQRKRRTEVSLDDELRSLVAAAAAAVHECLAGGRTPLAEYDSGRCDACSLIDVCQPRALRLKRGVAAWFRSRLNSDV